MWRHCDALGQVFVGRRKKILINIIYGFAAFFTGRAELGRSTWRVMHLANFSLIISMLAKCAYLS